jgi:hypothetical protein
MHHIVHTACQNIEKTSEEGGHMTHQRPFPPSIYLLTLSHFVTDHVPSSKLSLGGMGGLESGQGGGTGRGGDRTAYLSHMSPSNTSRTWWTWYMDLIRGVARPIPPIKYVKMSKNSEEGERVYDSWTVSGSVHKHHTSYPVNTWLKWYSTLKWDVGIAIFVVIVQSKKTKMFSCIWSIQKYLQDFKKAANNAGLKHL